MPIRFILKSGDEANKVPLNQDIHRGELAVSHTTPIDFSSGLPTLVQSLAGLYIRVGYSLENNENDKVVRIGNVYVCEERPDEYQSNNASVDYTGALWYKFQEKKLYINVGGTILDWEEITAYATETSNGLVSLCTAGNLDSGEREDSVVSVKSLRSWSLSKMVSPSVAEIRVSLNPVQAVDYPNVIESDSFWIHPYKGNTLALLVEGVWTGIKILRPIKQFFTLTGIDTGVTATAFWIYDIYAYFDGSLDDVRQDPENYQDKIKINMLPWQVQPSYWANELEDSAAKNTNAIGNYGDPTCVVGGSFGDLRSVVDGVTVRRLDPSRRLIGSVLMTSPGRTSFITSKTRVLLVDYPPKMLLWNAQNREEHRFVVPTHINSYNFNSSEYWRIAADSPLNRICLLNGSASMAVNVNYCTKLELVEAGDALAGMSIGMSIDNMGLDIDAPDLQLSEYSLPVSSQINSYSRESNLQSFTRANILQGSHFICPLERSMPIARVAQNSVDINWQWSTSGYRRFGLVGTVSI